MEAPHSREELRAEVRSDQPGNRIFRQYYTENDFVLSPEGILKGLSAVVCIVASVLFLSGGTCPGAPTLVTSAVTVALCSSALCAVLYAAVVLDLPLYAPQLYLFTDIILSSVVGVLLLIMAVLTMTMCDMNNAISYVHGPLGILNAGMIIGSAVFTYMSVMQLWDASHEPYEPPRPPPIEQDV
ncbi:uncharacterized protein LOC142979753 [Anticarsia gemmatalis]|uniref:uncharacterized protein LOC142979753 n=1 Tax=Anticarsia gemmatalis TaxID=129554 RepID=UPI003F76DF1A